MLFRVTVFTLALLFSFGLSFMDHQAQAAGVVAGEVVQVRGSASAQGGQPARTLRVGQQVYANDVLRTGSDGRLQVLFTDGSDLTLGENSEFFIEDYSFDQDKDEGIELLNLVKGTFVLASGQIAKANRDNLKVVTPVATIGIRGTQFWGGPIDGSFSVLLLQGQVEVKTPGGSVVLNPGQGVAIDDPAEGPGEVRVWDDEKRQRAFATVAF